MASPVIPSDPAAASVFASIGGLLDLVYAYDACDTVDPWKKYDPKALPITNDLSTVNVASGLWIKASTDATWLVTGTTPDLVNIPLCAGQNLIGLSVCRSCSPTQCSCWYRGQVQQSSCFRLGRHG